MPTIPCVNYFGKKLEDNHCGNYWQCGFCDILKEKKNET